MAAIERRCCDLDEIAEDFAELETPKTHLSGAA
jgi:hypothetical protein